ncbi:hypothetical protein JDV02_003853 [Purpureocillium takamizusanense]|nr:uncharacterized protein JDV02_003853 [Purpureocillium takamizusanense]UNI17515.1 hypothetical protein JDV02_003853 [Purpureocillium takamizusanense]
MGAPENDPRLNPGSFSRNPHAAHPEPFNAGVADDNDDKVSDLPASSTSTSTSTSTSLKDYNRELSSQPGPASGIRKPSFSMAKNIGIANQAGLHIILPESAARATSSGSLTDLRDCIVDMSVPTSQGRPFPGLALRDISNSLVVAGRVSGPVHITGVTDSILVVAARQVRIHECRHVDVYLHCGSHPIIEDCTGMRFAPLPSCYMTEADAAVENQWDQVDDFKWLKAGHSPNWTTLSQHQVLPDDVWTRVVPGQPGASVAETLRKVGIPRR